MVYIVEFGDGSTAQINSSNAEMARRIALTAYRGRLVLRVRPAGLAELSFRNPPPLQPKNS